MSRTEKDLRFALITLAFVTVCLLVMTFKYLRCVDMPAQTCLHPATFTPDPIENSKPLDGVEVWL